MTTFGVSMVKDEADVIVGCLRHMADEVDHLIVADNASTDGTRDLLADLADELPLTVVDDPDPAYYQSAKMTRLAEQAAAAGAEWVVPFDADELWIAPGADRIRDVVDYHPCNVAVARMIDHRASGIDSDDPDPFRRMAWREPAPAAFRKVAFRWQRGAVIQQGNHGVILPGAAKHLDLLEVHHFQYRSEAQFARKVRNGAAAYAATDLAEFQGAHWRAYGRILDRFGERGLARVYRRHHWHLSPTDAGLIHDPAPYLRWQ